MLIYFFFCVIFCKPQKVSKLAKWHSDIKTWALSIIENGSYNLQRSRSTQLSSAWLSSFL